MRFAVADRRAAAAVPGEQTRGASERTKRRKRHTKTRFIEINQLESKLAAFIN